MACVEFSNEFQMYENRKEIIYETIENGIVLPRVFKDNGPMWGLGGVCDRNNEFVESSAYHGGWGEHGGKYEWTDEDCAEEKVIYFGLFFRHWGHFLVDLVSRMWLLADDDFPKKNIKVAYLGEEEPTGNYLEFFELLGISRDQLIHIQRPTRFRKVIVPEVSCRTCIWYTKEYRSIFDYVAEKTAEENDIPGLLVPVEKVYFTRLNFGKAQNSEFGEKMLAEWLRVNGFTQISPETLSLRDQIYIWNHAKQIACINGTIPINAAFCKNQDLELLVLNKMSLVHKNLHLFLVMRKCNTVFLDVFREPFKGYPKSLGEGPYLLCITEDVKEFSRKHGMTVPFSKRQIRQEYLINYIRTFWSILGIRRRVRAVLSKTVPESVKGKLRGR